MVFCFLYNRAMDKLIKDGKRYDTVRHYMGSLKKLVEYLYINPDSRRILRLTPSAVSNARNTADALCKQIAPHVKKERRIRTEAAYGGELHTIIKNLVILNFKQNFTISQVRNLCACSLSNINKFESSTYMLRSSGISRKSVASIVRHSMRRNNYFFSIVRESIICS